MNCAYTFLLYNKINQENIWKKYFNASSAPIFCHCAKKEDIKSDFVRDHLIKTWVSTKWGSIGLVIAQLEMIREALKDKSVERIFLLSDSCIPLNRKEKIEERALNSNSMISLTTQHAKETLYKLTTIPKKFHRSHSQWCMLTRKHAQMLIENNFISDFIKTVIPDEHYMGTVLCYLGEEENINKDFQTFVDWIPVSSIQKTPKIFKKMSSGDIGKLNKSKSFFARKFSIDSDIEKHLYKLWG